VAQGVGLVPQASVPQKTKNTPKPGRDLNRSIIKEAIQMARKLHVEDTMI
jgi:hypothetical protein